VDEIRELADQMGLERVALGSDGSQVSIWDGRNFLFSESPWSIITLYRMVQRRAAPSDQISVRQLR